MVEFDRKFRALPPRPEVRVRTPSGCFWWTFAAVYSVYYVSVVTYMVRKHDMGYLLDRVFAVPRIVDFAITVTVCFYLSHLGLRFAGLNAFWKRHMSSGLLRDQRSRSMSLLRNPRHQSIGPLRNPGHQSIGLLRNPGYRSAREVAVLVECTRLLHVDLSDLLRVFNRAYGPVLVVFFAFVVFDMTFNYFVLLFAKQIHLDVWPAILLNAQAVMFVVSVLGLATWVSEQVTVYIPYNYISTPKRSRASSVHPRNRQSDYVVFGIATIAPPANAPTLSLNTRPGVFPLMFLRAYLAVKY